MKSVEEQAEQAVDLLEKHLGWMMPDTGYDSIELYHDTAEEEPVYSGDGVHIGYRLEATISSEEEDLPDSEFEFTGGHLIYGDRDRVRAEYTALVDEFSNRFDHSSLEYTDWENLEQQLDLGENL